MFKGYMYSSRIFPGNNYGIMTSSGSGKARHIESEPYTSGAEELGHSPIDTQSAKPFMQLLHRKQVRP